MLSGVPVVSRQGLSEAVRRGRVDTVLLAMPAMPRHRRIALVNWLEQLNVRVQTVPTFSDIASGRARLTEIQDVVIEDLLGRVDAAQTEDLDRLIQLYTNMKPTDAARIMDDLDIETTIMILGTMKPRTAAPILAKIPPVRARAVSKIILERSQLPADQDLTGIKLR